MSCALLTGGVALPMSGPLPPTVEAEKNSGSISSKSRSARIRSMSTDPTMPRQPTKPTRIAPTLFRSPASRPAPGTARGGDSGTEATGQVVLIDVIFELRPRVVTVRAPASAPHERRRAAPRRELLPLGGQRSGDSRKRGDAQYLHGGARTCKPAGQPSITSHPSMDQAPCCNAATTASPIARVPTTRSPASAMSPLRCPDRKTARTALSMRSARSARANV